jgi:hypothetical protein
MDHLVHVVLMVKREYLVHLAILVFLVKKVSPVRAVIMVIQVDLDNLAYPDVLESMEILVTVVQRVIPAVPDDLVQIKLSPNSTKIATQSLQ